MSDNQPTERTEPTTTTTTAETDASSADGEFVNPNDLRVQRDAEGQRLPQTAEAGDLGKVQIVPMAYGDVQEYFGGGDDVDLSPAALAGMFSEFVVKPDMSDLTADDVHDFYPLVPRDLLLAVMEVSGVEDVDVEVDGTDGSANVNVGGN